MKRIFALLTLSIFLLSSCKIYINTNDEKSNPVSFASSEKFLLNKIDLQNAKIKDIQGKTTSGDFRIIGNDNATPYVEVYAKTVNKKHKKEDVNKIIANYYTLNILTENHVLNIEAIRKKNISFSNANSVQFYFEIHVPTTTDTHIETSSGDLQLSNLVGTQHYTSTSGDGIFSKIKGNITMNCTSGDGTFTDVVSNKINFHATSGDLVLNNCSGDLTATTTSGDIIAKNHYGNTTAESTSGDATLDLLKGSIQTNATSGDVTISMQNPQDKISIATTSGDIHLKTAQTIKADLDIHGSNVNCNSLNNFSEGKGVTDKYIVGKINGGDIPVHIHSNSGDVTLQWL